MTFQLACSDYTPYQRRAVDSKLIQLTMGRDKESQQIMRSGGNNTGRVTVKQERHRLPLALQAYHLIRDRILRGDAPLGTVLSPRKLAKELGMSYLPVTHALQRLQDDGLVESRPRAGTRVRFPSDQEIRERYILREALECQSARLCSENATFEERLQLRRMAEHLDALYGRCAAEDVDKDFLFAVHTAHFNLHQKIAECGRCYILQKAIERNQVLIFNWLYDLAAGRRSLPHGFHKQLVDGTLQPDPQAAEETMREHIRYGLEGITESIKPQAEKGWRVKQQQ